MQNSKIAALSWSEDSDQLVSGSEDNGDKGMVVLVVVGMGEGKEEERTIHRGRRREYGGEDKG